MYTGKIIMSHFRLYNRLHMQLCFELRAHAKKFKVLDSLKALITLVCYWIAYRFLNAASAVIV